MNKVLSIALFVLLSEAWQVYLYATFAADDLAKIGLLGPLAGALAGAGVAALLEQLWPRLHPLPRSVVFAAITVFFISAGTTYYQCYAEQITHDARILHGQASYTYGAWGDNPWMMYPELANLGFGSGCQHLATNLWESVKFSLNTSCLWLPVVILICWITTWPDATPRHPDVRGALPA